MKTIYIIFIGLFIHFNVLAQSTILASANKAIGTTGLATYSIGQLGYIITSSESGSISNGIQQPFEITNLLNVNQNTIDTKITMYPNPSIDYVTLKINGAIIHLKYYLYDSAGRLLTKKVITKNKTIINIKNLVTNSYLLKITKGNQILKTVKIIKK